MTADYEKFRATVTAVGPRVAVVLGSGLGGAAAAFTPAAEIPYALVPGQAAPTVRGHGGRLAVGTWAGTPALVGFGRIHFYEGHARERVSALVRLAADLGARAVMLTNAAGGIHPALAPGSLMAIRDHLTWIGPDGWKRGAVEKRRPVPYSPRLLDLLRAVEAQAGRDLPAGTYAALTGPCYETPAEIRALANLGADAVGMSTALEAEAATDSGLEVAALSCITNRAAGLADGPLTHAEVEDTARLAVGRVSELLSRFLAHL